MLVDRRHGGCEHDTSYWEGSMDFGVKPNV